MPELIDIIAPSWADLFTFTVNTGGVDSVAIVPPGGGTSYAGNRLGNKIFTKGDSPRILSCGVMLPESFTFFYDVALSTPLPLLDFNVVGVTSGHVFNNPNWQGNAQYIPQENYELVTDTYFPCGEAIDTVDPTKTLFDENFRINLYFSIALKISMLGVPVALNTKVFRVVPYLKVLHTIPLS